MANYSFRHTTKTFPKLPFEEMKNDILGKKYELSFAVVGETTAQNLNQTYRKKDYVPNVLSFPLEKLAGEIVICLPVAKREAKKHSMSVKGFVGFLFIHGLLHLKGYHHGATMTKAEDRYKKKYRLS